MPALGVLPPQPLGFLLSPLGFFLDLLGFSRDRQDFVRLLLHPHFVLHRAPLDVRSASPVEHRQKLSPARQR
ncbi:MAG: hypothetical protein VKK97_05660 [Synechococcaceae cyanobacterium]|nr:hypothetical protein [Synechococcaceae cyanobacterium]